MTRTAPDSLSPDAALAALAWQLELGADEAIGEGPVNRFELAARAEPAAPPPAQAEREAPGSPGRTPARAAAEAGEAGEAVAQKPEALDPVAEAARIAATAKTLPELAAAMEAFEHCALKPAARSFVFADGDPAARVMIVGEAPGREEDREGRPFVGRAGQLLDRMLGAIGLSRQSPDPATAVYITNVLPWRPPANRTPEPAEIAMHLPFLERHIALAEPEILILMGNTPCQALMGRAGITRIRGQWAKVAGRPALPMFHPAYLLRNPAAKREAWADLLDLAARLEETP
ncbi:uracil-DNA glycosylase family protein [Pseudoroseicyclus sp. CXY001]|uniref:uracil-DNA glycosylase n=1 Tax=Pseudoroseicyclus sp. CXY001 TaxID=3242492 RepID=UPI003570DFD6